MKKQHIAHIFGILIVAISLILFVIVLFNYNSFKTQITDSVTRDGLIALFIFCFLLEAFPTILGQEIPVLTIMLLGFNFVHVMAIILIATILANWFSYFIGFYLKDFARGFVEPANLKRYDKLWHKYGTATMVVTAVSPIPYIPAIAGIFKMNFWYFTFLVIGSRLLRHIAVFSFLYWLLIL